MKVPNLESKRKEREVKKKKVRRERWLKIFALAGVIILLTFILKSFVNSGFLDIKIVKISGNIKLTEEEILSLASIPENLNILRLNSSDVEKKLIASPWIRGAKLIKSLPKTVKIEIEEEQPVITVKNKDGFWLVSDEIVALEKLPKRPKNITAIIIDKEIDIELGYKIKNKMIVQLVSIFNGMDKSFKKKITLGSAIGDDMYFMLGKKDVQIVYGDGSELMRKNLIVTKILDDISKKKMNVYYIDVRVPSKPAIKKVPTAMEIRR